MTSTRSRRPRAGSRAEPQRVDRRGTRHGGRWIRCGRRIPTGMTTTTVVRYRVHPDQADRNAELVRAVYDELRESGPAGLAYSTYRLEDGTFVHVAEEEHPGQLREVAAFRAF